MAGADKNAANAAAVRIRSLTISFGRTNVLRNLDLQLASGDARIILGPNGAGKSTLFNAVSGLVKARSGSIELGAEPVTGTSPHVIARRFVSRGFQVPQLSPSLTVLEHIWLCLVSPLASGQNGRVASNDLRNSARQILASFGLEDLRDTLPAGMTHAERKLLDISMAMSRELPILLLDEPGAGLGSAEKELLRTKLLDGAGKATKLIIEHDVEFIEQLGLPVLFMHEGRFLFEGALSEVEEKARKAGVYF